MYCVKSYMALRNSNFARRTLKVPFPPPSSPALLFSSFLVQGTPSWCSDTIHAASGMKTPTDISRGHQLTAKYCKTFSSFFKVSILILHGFKHSITSHTNGELEIHAPWEVWSSDWNSFINLSPYRNFEQLYPWKSITTRQEHNTLYRGVLGTTLLTESMC